MFVDASAEICHCEVGDDAFDVHAVKFPDEGAPGKSYSTTEHGQAPALLYAVRDELLECIESFAGSDTVALAQEVMGGVGVVQ